MATQAQVIVNHARRILLDPSPGVTWDDTAMLLLYNGAEKEAVLMRPDLYRVFGNISLAAGVEQALPAGGSVVMNIRRNVVSGKACRLVDWDLVQENNLLVSAATQELDVQEWAVDARAPERFYVLPPNNGAGQVVALYCSTPADLTTLSQNMSFADEYRQPMIHLLVAQALSENTERQDITKSDFHRKRAGDLLGVNQQSRIALVAKLIGQGGQ